MKSAFASNLPCAPGTTLARDEVRVTILERGGRSDLSDLTVQEAREDVHRADHIPMGHQAARRAAEGAPLRFMLVVTIWVGTGPRGGRFVDGIIDTDACRLCFVGNKAA